MTTGFLSKQACKPFKEYRYTAARQGHKVICYVALITLTNQEGEVKTNPSVL